MNVIGYNLSPPVRERMWSDLIESRRCVKEQRGAGTALEIQDQKFYAETLEEYVAREEYVN